MHRWWKDRQPSFQPSASTVGADPAPPCPAKLGLLASPLLSLVENLPPPSFARSMVRSGPPMVVADLAISSGYSNRSSGGREWNYSLGMLPPCLASWAWCLQLHQTLLSSSIVTNCEGNSLKGWGYEIAYIAGKGDSASACVSGALRSTLARLEQPKAGEKGVRGRGGVLKWWPGEGNRVKGDLGWPGYELPSDVPGPPPLLPLSQDARPGTS